MTPSFTRAIVRPPGKSFVEALTTSTLGVPNHELALEQHNAYVAALKRIGLDMLEMEPDERFPDSTFVEDTALLTTECAIITRPGANSRRGETDAIKSVLSDQFTNIEHIHSPGTIDAGDISMVGAHFYIGNSERTNAIGANQMIAILEKYGMTGSIVPIYDMLHLKSGISYIENNNLIVAGEIAEYSGFETLKRIIVDVDELYAANCLWINDHVLVAAGHPKLQSSIESLGYDTIALEMSEFQKADGGLSCLSLRF